MKSIFIDKEIVLPRGPRAIKIRIIFILLAGFFILSCGSSKHDEYVQIITSTKWQYDADAIRAEVGSFSLSDRVYNALEQMLVRLDGAVFSFYPDGKMMLEVNDIQNDGTWFISADGKEFAMLLIGTLKEPYKIREITNERFILEVDQAKGMTFPKIFIPVE